ncbi:HNH endonuclease [Paraburkholderia sediminicola]|uniref:HNH endonuclease n=1 Tax=Paraburkholderia sediminicola TaxID=458836 RepID=UPI0038B94B50
MNNRVTSDGFAAAHAAALRVLARELTTTQARKLVMEECGMESRTASGYIGAYLFMRRGRIFKTIISADGLRYMLERLHEEGPTYLHAGLEALMAHIEYLSTKSGREPGMRTVHAEFAERLSGAVSFNETPAELDVKVDRALNDSRAVRAERLLKANKTPERIIVSRREFRRNPDVIAEALKRASGICEACKNPAPFSRPNGQPFLEVHHMQRLADGGEDTVENAIALCPNCHRERHYGAGYVKDDA